MTGVQTCALPISLYWFILLVTNQLRSKTSLFVYVLFVYVFKCVCIGGLTSAGLTEVGGPGVARGVFLQQAVGHQAPTAGQQGGLNLPLDPLQTPSNTLLPATRTHTAVWQSKGRH